MGPIKHGAKLLSQAIGSLRPRRVKGGRYTYLHWPARHALPVKGSNRMDLATKSFKPPILTLAGANPRPALFPRQLVAGGILGAVAGYQMGNQDFSSFMMGGVAGMGGGFLGRAAGFGLQGGVLSASRAIGKGAAPETARMARKAGAYSRVAGNAMRTQEGRSMMFATGGMLSGGLFGSMFMSQNRTNHATGFNSQRGNRI